MNNIMNTIKKMLTITTSMKRYDNLHVRYYSQQRKTYLTMSMLLNEIDRYARIVYIHSEEGDEIYQLLNMHMEVLKSKLKKR